MDVLGLFSWAYTWARDLLGEGLGINFENSCAALGQPFVQYFIVGFSRKVV
jgi:hypothetical protein